MQEKLTYLKSITYSDMYTVNSVDKACRCSDVM